MLEIQNEIIVPTPLVELREELISQKNLRVFVKADFLTHPQLSGNKWRKLKYNLIAAKDAGKSKILSFGGAYSNHVYALGGVARLTDFEVHCIIRGEELNHQSNDTLKYAHESGVNLHFVSRSDYRNKEQLGADFGESFYIIPEGGSNRAALTGVAEVVDEILEVSKPDVIVSAMGTGGTVAGLLSNHNFQGNIIGIPVIKGGAGLLKAIEELIELDQQKVTILPDYHGGGYGKTTSSQKSFAASFTKAHHLELDNIYTVKLFHAVYDLIRNDYFSKNMKIVIYHSGGLRG